MVVVHPGVAARLDFEVYARVVGEEVQDVVEETDAGLYLGAAFAVEFEAHLHVRLAGLSFSATESCHKLSFCLQR
jgi:hypothetical protein